VVGLSGPPDMLECEVMKLPMGASKKPQSSAAPRERGGTALRFLGPEPALGVSRRDLQKRLGRWLINQHGAQWRGLGYTQGQALEFIFGPSLDTRAKFMTFNKIQSRVVTGLLTGHNTLRRHLYLPGLLDSRCVYEVWGERGNLGSHYV